MNYSEIVLTAIQALRGNLLRTLLTMLGIIIGITSVILIISMGDGATARITNELSSFGTNTIVISPGSNNPRDGFQLSDLEILGPEVTDLLTDSARFPNIEAVSGLANQQYTVSANGQSATAMVNGVSDQYPAIQTLEIGQGEFFTQDDVQSHSRVAVLGSELAEDIFGTDAQIVGESIKIGDKSFRIIGVMLPKDSSLFNNPNKEVYVPVTAALRSLLGQDYYTVVMAKAHDQQLIDQTVTDIETAVMEIKNIEEGERKGFEVDSSKELLQTVDTVTGLLTSLLAGIAAISLVVGGIGIMNIMLVTVTERTKEIGLLKSIGARDRDILTQFLIEAIVLTVIGGIIGMTLGITFSYLIAQAVDIPFVVSVRSVLMAVGVSSLVGIIFGYYPARQAARLSPIDALRYE